MIVIEGCDSTGKTTLARRLSDEHGYVYWKWTERHTYEQTINWLSAPARINQKIVCDRFPLFSEEVYGPLLRGGSRFSQKERDNLYLLLQSLRPHVVLCTEVNRTAFREAEQLPSREQNERARVAYMERFDEWQRYFPCGMYAYSAQYPLVSLVNQDYGPPEWWKTMFEGSYAGMGQLGSSQYFLLAESIGPRNVHHIPFEAGPSGLFLSEVLKETDTPLCDVFITNYVKGNLSEEENQRMLEEELLQIKPQRVIVMGSIARRGIPSIQQAGVPFTTIIHPSYWIRMRRPKEEYYHLFQEAKTGKPHDGQLDA